MLLDTCTFLWLVAEPDRLGAGARRAIDSAEQVHLSDVSVLEISLKWSAGKLRLPAPPRHWIEQQAGRWSLARLALDRRHVYRTCELPEHHRDPFDRLLVAQALEEDLPIITPDPSISRYPVPTVW